MTGEIINLRQRRKALARVEKEAEAASNRAKFGRSKPEKEKLKAESERAAKILDGHKQDT